LALRHSYCSVCFKFALLDRHHIIPKSEGGDGSKQNIAYTCRPCHRKIHQFGLTKRYTQDYFKGAKRVVARLIELDMRNGVCGRCKNKEAA
jgi:hypothetical protein